MDEDDVEEIAFEILPNGTWQKIREDPEDDEQEIITPVGQPANVYGQIKKLKKQGWIVDTDVDPDFNGYILFRPREVKE